MVAVVTRPDARSGRGRTPRARRRCAVRAEALGIEVLTPARARRPRVPGAAARARPRRLPGRRLRRPVPQSALDIPAARLGQPALLAAAGLARGRPGAARDHGRRRGHRRHDVPASRRASTPGRCFGVMTETIRPTDTAGDLLGRLADGRRRAAGRDAGRHRGRHAAGRCRSRATASRSPPRSPSRTRGSTGTRPALAVDRQVRGCTPAPGAWTTFRGERVKLGPVRAADAGEAGPLAPGEIAGRATARACSSAPAPAPSGWARSRPHGKKPMAAADWARGVRIETRESGSAMTDHGTEAARRGPAAGAPPAAAGVRADAARADPARPRGLHGDARRRRRRLRQPRAAEAAARASGSTGGTPAFATELAYGAIAAARASTTPIIAAAAGRPVDADRRQRARHAAARRPPAARHAGRRPRRGRRDRRAGAAGQRRRRRAASSTP